MFGRREDSRVEITEAETPTQIEVATGEPDGPPTSVALPICDLGTGIWAVQGILAALYERWHTVKGRLVECSLLKTAIGFSSRTSLQWLADREKPTRQGSRHRQNVPYQRMQTKDGNLMVGAAGHPPRRIRWHPRVVYFYRYCRWTLPRKTV